MTVGHWYREAYQALRVAATAMAQRPADNAADINAAVIARSAVYAQLARATELLVGARPAAEVPDRAGASTILRRRGQRLTQLYVGLRAATIVDRQFPPSPAAVTAEPARSLLRAADAVAVIGDILASHVPPGQGPRTPEGLAIRAGGGVQSGIAEIARLTSNAVIVDIALPGWLNHGRGHLAEIYRPAAETARWTASSGLGGIARELIAAGRGQPPLDGLDIARSPLNPAPSVRTVDDAVAAMAAARSSMWQDPGQVTGAHLQLGTQLGLAVHILISGGAPRMVGGWRQAAIAAADLRATPLVGAGRDAAAELTEVLRWARTQAAVGSDGHAQLRDRQVVRLSSELPFLAATLHRGLSAALQRGELFVKAEMPLARPAGSLIFRAAKRWRSAVSDDDVVQDLNRGLAQRQQPDNDGRGTVARAFPRPPRPRASMAQTPTRAADVVPGQGRRRTR
ncbi:hypothetical protein KBX06_26930 [Micromonospora sp. C31]|uniref:hypothetical protein n=1 Tax=Micromonospora sp. C31 TaxID=2824876 RepID=UPI001B36099B|nr:hypothetical protein [Micromonospora sp. C31]MBQ1076756.1 hypothetical protein [Micromonospora sp. C31]